ncbi:hypothetical protein, partial [Pseudoflavonifractor phocaeensis]
RRAVPVGNRKTILRQSAFFPQDTFILIGVNRLFRQAARLSLLESRFLLLLFCGQEREKRVK